MKRTNVEHYAAAVVEVLATDFPELADETTAAMARNAIARHATAPADPFEVIIDSPTLANWRLRPHRERPKRVRIACYRFELSAEDLAKEQRINATLERIT